MQEIDAGQILLAFENGEFFHAYQPIVELSTGAVPHVEALIRWSHPTHGVIAPGAFLPLIYGADLADALTDFGLRDALGSLDELRGLYGPDVAVALNLSHRQLQEPETLAGRVHDALKRSGEQAQSLFIEVVEDLTANDINHTRSAFHDLRELGVRIILDDFGTGASSLTALTDMEYDGLKIDRSFVQGLTTSAVARSVIEAVLAFGARTNISVVAEGVETALELQALTELGCSFAQGYLLGRPKPISDGPQHLGYTPAAPLLTPEQNDQDDLAAILDRVHLVDPRSLVPFDAMRAELEALDAAVTSNGRRADQVRCEIGRRMALASIYAGREDLLISWSVRTSSLAARIGAWGYSAEALAMIANCSQVPEGSPGLRVDALVQALEIRMTRPIEHDRAGGVDNGIGSAFAHLGLWRHARTWWADSIERHGKVDDIGSVLSCLNLTDLEIHRLEGGALPMIDATPVELSIALCEQMLSYVDGSDLVPHGLPAALGVRLQLVRGDIAGAASALETIDDSGGNALSHFQLTQARARVAQALGDNEAFFGHTSELIRVLGGHALLSLHERRAQHLHADALLASGRVKEAALLLRELSTTHAGDDAERLMTLFDWIRLNVDLNVRFTELFDGRLDSSAS